MSNIENIAPSGHPKNLPRSTKSDSNPKNNAISEMEKEDRHQKSANPQNQNEAVFTDQEIESEIEKMIEKRRKCITSECIKAKKRLDLNSSNIDDSDALTISMFLSEQYTYLELCHLGSNLFEDEGLINILSGLQWHTSLQELYLGNNNISPLGLSALIDTLPIFPALEILGLTNIGMTDELTVALSFSLMELPFLKTLLLNCNEIEDSGFTTFSILLSSKKVPLTTLQLGYNKPTGKGLVSLLKALHTDETLKHLHLNNVNFNDEALVALNKMLVKNQGLEELNLSNCGLTDDSIPKLKEGLMYNNTLKYLHLFGNKITDEGAVGLLNIIQDHNNTLLGVNLSEDHIDNIEILDDLKVFLKQNEVFTKEIPMEISKPTEEPQSSPTKEEEEEEIPEEEEIKNKEEDQKQQQQQPIENKPQPAAAEEEENEEEDEEDLEKLESELLDAEKEAEEEWEQHKAKKEQEKDKKRAVLEKVWKGFSNKKGGLLKSKFEEK